MESVVTRMATEGEPSLPFMFIWANEPWTRHWTGETGEVLQTQVNKGSFWHMSGFYSSTCVFPVGLRECNVLGEAFFLASPLLSAPKVHPGVQQAGICNLCPAIHKAVEAHVEIVEEACH